ncbi:hypothetical protein [Aliarcobacter butzleri]|uniref:hypothetical protein n=1 Tax=Aliarcobacter butzleri TaxID=28197 RepID=UPI0021B62762|nr:hypothetical protein [Aliarcobacter butzleri]MCT7643875.1 hypothetical protein [Aliarcobacter butzleri]
MTRLFIVFFMVILFSSCSSKTQNSAVLNTFPHYNKDKVNLYLLNNETELKHQIDYIYKISSLNFNKEITLCYNQYSYTELDEGNYIIQAQQKDKRHAFKSRDDHESYTDFLKNGNIYVLKTNTSYDLESAGKFLLGSILLNPLDPKINVIQLQNDEALNSLNEMSNFKNLLGKRPYPFRAEQNNDNCINMALKNTF